MNEIHYWEREKFISKGRQKAELSCQLLIREANQLPPMISSLPDQNFTAEQQNYLSGFLTGVLHRQNIPFLGQNSAGQFTNNPAESVEQTVFGTPIDDLCKEERIKHAQNGLDCYPTILANALKGEFPAAEDVFRYKFYGLFHVAPAQNSFMLRARVPGCVIMSHQFRGFAEIAADWGGGYCDITTRGNLQVREIQPENCVKVLDKVVELGLTSRGAGADNVRNVTATPTTGFDTEEFIDVMPLAKGMHHYILNNRDLYGMPRKFNIAFDSAGTVSACADTNDIGFYACKVEENNDGIAPGVYFRMQLCGITGHKQFASDCGALLTADECIPVAAAILRVFIEHGDRTNRKRARLKYLIDDWGTEKFLTETQKKLAFPIRYYAVEKCIAGIAKSKHGHVGIHKQNDGKNYVGIVIPVGKMQAEDMHKIAEIAETFGKSELRLTNWQNIIIPHVGDDVLEYCKQAIIDAGFSFTSSAISGGIVACTGSFGCKYAQAETKDNAVKLGKYLDSKIEIDNPINIHITGCPHSCAQHYVGDIGMQAVKVKLDTDEKVDGFNIVLGGGLDDTQAIAKEVLKSIPATDVPEVTEHILKTYMSRREGSETFLNFTRRYSESQLQEMFTLQAVTSAN